MLGPSSFEVTRGPHIIRGGKTWAEYVVFQIGCGTCHTLSNTVPGPIIPGLYLVTSLEGRTGEATPPPPFPPAILFGLDGAIISPKFLCLLKPTIIDPFGNIFLFSTFRYTISGVSELDRDRTVTGHFIAKYL